jgi:hypothetical protein
VGDGRTQAQRAANPWKEAEKFDRQVDGLKLAAKAVKAGVSGVVFGRNVVQAERPAAGRVSLLQSSNALQPALKPGGEDV